MYMQLVNFLLIDINFMIRFIFYSSIQNKYRIKVGYDNFLDTIKTKTEYDILSDLYSSTQEDNPFTKSGFVPYKLVAGYCWIQK